MKIYRVYEVSSWGDTTEEEYFLNLKDAQNRFKQIIKEKRKNKQTCTKEELDGESNFKNNPHPDKTIIKNINWAYMYKCSYEYDEWDIAINDLRIKEIEVQE